MRLGFRPPLAMLSVRDDFTKSRCRDPCGRRITENGPTKAAAAFLGNRFFAEVAELNRDEGAKRVIARHIEHMTTVPLVDAAFDVDTPVDYERLTSSSWT
jgi:hypothetical protein